jgi:hypothetical protein
LPRDEDSAKYYGRGTRWCTAAENNNRFDYYYEEDDPLFIFLPKQPKYNGEKYQIHFGSNQFMDEKDGRTDVRDLLCVRFGNLLPLFKDYGNLSDTIELASDELLAPILKKCADFIFNKMWEFVNEWEMQDDYWYKSLRDQGYVDEDGDVDFDRAYEEIGPWYKNNDDVWHFVKDTSDFCKELTPAKIRQYTRDYVYNVNEYSEDILEIKYIDKVLSYATEHNIRHGENHEDAIDDSLYIFKDKTTGWQVKQLGERGPSGSTRPTYEINSYKSYDV